VAEEAVEVRGEERGEDWLLLILLALAAVAAYLVWFRRKPSEEVKPVTHEGSESVALTYADEASAVVPSRHEGSDYVTIRYADFASVTAPAAHEGSDSVALTYTDAAGVSVIDPSGLDPYDPLWMPSDGWTYVYRFESAEEIAQAFNWPGSYVKVENGVLKYDVPPQGMDGSERYFNDQSWKRAAVCIKLKIIEAKRNYSNIIYFNPAFTPDREVGVGFDLVAGSTSVKITDWYPWPGTSYDFTPPDDWFVIVVDNTPNQTPYIRIYDKNKNLLFERVLTLNATPWICEDLFFEVHNDTDYGTWNIEIDWITLKY
jgi:hypothetical protein